MVSLSELTLVEVAIGHEFSQRVQEFHIVVRNDGLVLEGRTRSYFTKQLVQQAVISAINLPITANNISVDDSRLVARRRQVLESDQEVNTHSDCP